MLIIHNNCSVYFVYWSEAAIFVENKKTVCGALLPIHAPRVSELNRYNQQVYFPHANNDF